MRHQSGEFLDNFLKRHTDLQTVLDVGSADISGTIKNYLSGKEYLGVDMVPAPNVDEVVNGHELKDHFKDRKFDLVICFDVFEHDDAFWLTLEGLRYVTKPGGYMMIGVPCRNCPEHNHPADYWRFMPQCVDVFYKGFEDIEHVVQKDDPSHCAEDEIYMVGRKPL